MKTVLMRRQLPAVALAIALIAAAPPAWGQVFDSGSDGSDGAFAPMTDTTVALPDDGILNYTTVTIPKGVNITFARNRANTPVYILATGDVLISGNIDVSGKAGLTVAGLHGFSYVGGLGGPGGSDGGSVGFGNSAGFGPGPGLENNNGGHQAGGGGSSPINGGGGGSCCYCGGNGGGGGPWADIGMFYLHGGSGGGAANGVPGGGGGGAILVASSTEIVLDGTIQARGGAAWKSGHGGGGGGGGGSIRIAAPKISGSGNMTATDANSNCGGGCNPGCGGDGVVRMETYDLTGEVQANSSPGAIISLPEKGFPYAVDERPRLEITQVGVKTPNIADYSDHTHTQPGVKVPTGQEITIEVSAQYVPLGTKVQLILNTQGQGRFTTETVGLAGTLAESTATGKLTIPAGMKVGAIEAWIPKIDVINNPAP